MDGVEELLLYFIEVGMEEKRLRKRYRERQPLVVR